MSQPIVYLDHSSVVRARLPALTRAMTELTTFVETNMPRLISYGFFLNPGKTEMTVVAIHPDSASLEYHMDAGREQFRKFADFIELSAIEVYGQVSGRVLERLHQKAQMLGNASVTVHDFYSGFAR